jgi:hypothetical protein
MQLKKIGIFFQSSVVVFNRFSQKIHTRQKSFQRTAATDFASMLSSARNGVDGASLQ